MTKGVSFFSGSGNGRAVSRVLDLGLGKRDRLRGSHARLLSSPKEPTERESKLRSHYFTAGGLSRGLFASKITGNLGRSRRLRCASICAFGAPARGSPKGARPRPDPTLRCGSRGARLLARLFKNYACRRAGQGAVEAEAARRIEARSAPSRSPPRVRERTGGRRRAPSAPRASAAASTEAPTGT